MTNIVPFEFEGHAVRVVTDENGELLFVGKDVAEALGYADTANAIKLHCRGVAKYHPILDSLGRKQEVRVLTEGDMFRLVVNSTPPSAETFERLVFDEILPTIRKTGSYGASKADASGLLKAAKLFPPLFRVARMIGCDRNAAAVSANQSVLAASGLNLLAALGQTHMTASNQEAQYFTPTELGQRIGASGRKFNLLLAVAGLQSKAGEEWEVTDAGKDFARIYDTGKRHGSGVPIQQIKWSAQVLSILQTEEA
ncbi:MAG: Bro-N domain-containing protein [Burkholderia gladioli]